MAKFFALLCFVCTYLSAETKIIVVYGASCSGKSTLSKAVAGEFGAPWHVIDRDIVIDQRQDEERADEYLLEEIQNALEMGLNVIVDTQDPTKLLQAISPYEPFMIFVYAKMPLLIERDIHRSRMRNRTMERAYFSRCWVYNTFAELLTIESKGAIFVDTIELNDIPEDICTFHLNEYSQEFFHILIQAKVSMPVYAKCPCDVIIKSCPLIESLQEIQKHYASRKNRRVVPTAGP